MYVRLNGECMDDVDWIWRERTRANRRLEAVILCGLKEVEGNQQLIRWFADSMLAAQATAWFPYKAILLLLQYCTFVSMLISYPNAISNNIFELPLTIIAAYKIELCYWYLTIHFFVSFREAFQLTTNIMWRIRRVSNPDSYSPALRSAHVHK